MILHNGPARRGVTLLEVLTAIFIMGVGMLAILTLFPLGALTMARAVRDDRAATIAANAAALAVALDLRNDTTVATTLGTAPTNYTLAADGPGFPVLVDPVYATNLLSTQLGTLAVSVPPTPGLQRVGPSYATTAQSIARWFTFQDEITFDTLGVPTSGPSGSGAGVNRPGTYSFAYMLRRPRATSAALTELTVIVYANRATDQVSGETGFNTTPSAGPPALNTKGSNLVQFTIPANTDRPNIRKGSWILDTSFRQIGAANQGTVNGYFYQVASVTDTNATTMTLELEMPLKEDMTAMVFMENVVTVLERGTSWRP